MNSSGWTFGEVAVISIVEMIFAFPADVLLAVPSAQELERHRDWLYPDFMDESGNLLVAVQSFLVEADGKRIVVDTCTGREPPEAWASMAVPGREFLDSLAAVGFERESVDVVVCTHLHFDHVGWNTMRDGGSVIPTFPNARYLFAEPALAAWKEQRAAEIPTLCSRESMHTLIEAGVVDPVPLDHRVCESVWLESTPGHTRGHVSVHIGSQGQRALITGDCASHPVQWAEPGWAQDSDVDAVQSTATRRRLLAEHADAGTTILGSHYPPPTAGHLTMSQGRSRFVPTAHSTAMDPGIVVARRIDPQ
ncbi:MBL fold metallo-hydrolase [Rhodococcus jostii]|uniref:Glyoxylase, beta-lactamase superfamily II n=1 Tax=Rhodococcus jostii TaxID=132919 RepID=A0A1H4U2I7_RHOJO|nr:MBL fold metallo-hydrolase [Rhodococcus jostii]SEC62973.1 Glyoxylase, beta-lactamase superfamily II [Rhodococcus jostii]